MTHANLFHVETFEDWLEGELKARGWTIAELARRGHMKPSSLSRVLSGTRKAGPELCNAIARALRIPPEDVFRRAGLLPPSAQAQGVSGSDELILYYREMPPEDRRRLLAIARTLRDAALARLTSPDQPPSRDDLLRFLDTLSDEEIEELASALQRKRKTQSKSQARNVPRSSGRA